MGDDGLRIRLRPRVSCVIAEIKALQNVQKVLLPPLGRCRGHVSPWFMLCLRANAASMPIVELPNNILAAREPDGGARNARFDVCQDVEHGYNMYSAKDIRRNDVSIDLLQTRINYPCTTVTLLQTCEKYIRSRVKDKQLSLPQPLSIVKR